MMMVPNILHEIRQSSAVECLLEKLDVVVIKVIENLRKHGSH
jgi:hypothetical protein